MCGIIGVAVKDNHKDLLRNLYEIFVNQQTRGVEGAGVSIHNGSKMFRYRTTSPFRLFNVYNYWFWRKITAGSAVLVHHRTPTSTSNRPAYNHPIANEDNSIHLIHNGVVRNDDALFKTLKKTHTFETMETKKRFTDSEVIVHVFEDAFKGDVVEALKEVALIVKGSYAIALSLRNDPNIYLLRHSNPIIISQDIQGNHYFSSEYNYYSDRFARIHELVNGEIGKLNADGYTSLCTVDIPEPKTYQYCLNEERDWSEKPTLDDEDGEPDVFTDSYGRLLVKDGDYWREKDYRHGLE
jgi:glutamine---fructose-6-phosphate transaminase (isomerizing)